MDDTFQPVIAALLDEGKPFPPRLLYLFSDIDPSALDMLLASWSQVSQTRKQALLEDLDTLADADTLLSFDDFAAVLLHDPDAGVRTRAIRLLWQAEDPKLVSSFIQLLSDTDEGVQAAAAGALGLFVYLGEVEDIPAAALKSIETALFDLIDKTRNVHVQRRALESLGYSSNPKVPAMLEQAYAQKDPHWLRTALLAMGRSSDTRWEKAVIAKLTADNFMIAEQAIQSAGELELKAARKPLLALLADEDAEELRYAIVWALSKIGGEGVRAALETLIDTSENDEEIEYIEEALDNLSFTDDMGIYDMFDFDPDDESTNEDDR